MGMSSGDQKNAMVLVRIFLDLPFPVQAGIVGTGIAIFTGIKVLEHQDIQKRPAMVEPMIKQAMTACNSAHDWNGAKDYQGKLKPLLMTAWTHSLQKLKDHNVTACLDPSLNGVSERYDYTENKLLSSSLRFHGDRSVTAIFRTEADGRHVVTFKVLPEHVNYNVKGVDLNYSPGQVMDKIASDFLIVSKAAPGQVHVLIRQEGERCELDTTDKDCYGENVYYWAKGKDYEELKAKYPAMFGSPLRPLLMAKAP